MINHSKKRASFLSKPFIIAAVLLVAGCSLEKKSGFNRNMQNLTAHYNILFNANEILRLKQVAYAAAFVDNYNELLNVYPDTTAKSATPDKDLEEAIAKGNKIINIKEQSHYLGDAYLVIGKANYLEGNYFNATEFLSYVIKSYPQRMDLVQQALVWKARALIYLNNLPDAKIALDTALKNIDPKKHKNLNASVYAAKLQYDINAQEYADGEIMAKQAIENCSERILRLRWTFILSQLQELNQKPGEAVTNYTNISHSNVSFEMAFNASLNRIRIEDARDGIKTDRTERLLALLKEPNNKEFKDQIYYQVAELQMKDKKVDDAIKNYKLSVRNSVKDQSQKGLSYLRLATTYFKEKADYVTAKKYYDSTLISLPPNYPGYAAVRKMTDNLKILTDALQIIAREDTLQSLAKMNDSTRNKVIDKMVSDHTLQQEQSAAAVALEANTVNETNGTGTDNNRGFDPRRGRLGNNGNGNNNSSPGTTFYFYNSNAVTQGFNDFKRKWGDRKLEDDWRRSSRANTNITANSVNQNAIDPDAPIGNQPGAKPKTVNAGGYRAELVAGLPLTPEKLAASNIKVYHAYVDIANFYRDILNDKPEAITAYENVLRRFPNDPNRAAIYYNLYRLYSDADPKKAGHYKDILLKEFADTPFAKIISDPNYAKKLEDENAEFTAAYNRVFDLYAAKKYNDVISGVPQVLKQYPGNKLSAQLAYLKAVAEGHSEKADAFTDTLKKIIAAYPDDKLIAPLITRQLAFINENLAEVQARPAVIIGDNPQDIPFTLDPALQEETAYRPVVTYNPKPVEQVRIDRPQDIAVAAPQQQAVKIAPPASQTKAPEIKLPTPAPVKQMTGLPKKPDTVAVVKQAVKKPDTIVKQAVVAPPVIPPVVQQPAAPPATRTDTVTAQSQQQAAITGAPPAELKKTDLIPSIFNERDSSNYYFAVNVMSGTTNLASTRFGFGQFNRANYAGKGIKHQLLPVGNSNQIIYVGRFATLADAKKYAREIIPLLPDIMKTTKEKYVFFIITQENLNKLADSKLLDNYYEYYQRNF
ncbi:MAG TPA: tetratricopeptide repeat protein [Mucilaginibacter sp.]